MEFSLLSVLIGIQFFIAPGFSCMICLEFFLRLMEASQPSNSNHGCVSNSSPEFYLLSLELPLHLKHGIHFVFLANRQLFI